jgi:hypothetical protein
MTNTKSRRDGHETPHDAYVRAVLVRPGLVAARPFDRFPLPLLEHHPATSRHMVAFTA